MRYGKELYEFKAGFIGVLFNSVNTAFVSSCGNTIDTHGFHDMLATLLVGVPEGSAGQSIVVAGKFQEADSANGTFADISTGALTNSATFSSLTVIANTTGVAQVPFAMAKLSEIISGQARKRYLRVNVYATTTAIGRAWLPISVNVLLGRAQDTLYITNPSSIASGNSGFVGMTWGSHCAPAATA